MGSGQITYGGIPECSIEKSSGYQTSFITVTVVLMNGCLV